MSGAREWASFHGFDFGTFVKEGVDIEILRAANCPLCNRACDQAEKRAKGAE